MVFIAVRTSRHSADWASVPGLRCGDPGDRRRLPDRGRDRLCASGAGADVAAYDALYQKLIARIDMLGRLGDLRDGRP